LTRLQPRQIWVRFVIFTFCVASPLRRGGLPCPPCCRRDGASLPQMRRNLLTASHNPAFCWTPRPLGERIEVRGFPAHQPFPINHRPSLMSKSNAVTLSQHDTHVKCKNQKPSHAPRGRVAACRPNCVSHHWSSQGADLSSSPRKEFGSLRWTIRERCGLNIRGLLHWLRLSSPNDADSRRGANPCSPRRIDRLCHVRNHATKPSSSNTETPTKQ
jgi:hypothetical protein